MSKKILDLSAGNRAIWFKKDHQGAMFLDKRAEVNPTIVCDTRSIPEAAGSGFDLIVWDPPHMNCGPNSNMSKVYGYHTTAEILDTIEKTAIEAHRVSVPNALMALKWNNHDIRLQRVFDLMPQWEPLFGHLTKDGPGSQTYWTMLRRIGPTPPDSRLDKVREALEFYAAENIIAYQTSIGPLRDCVQDGGKRAKEVLALLDSKEGST